MSTEYNGWTNYETWNVALWIQNEEPLYNMARQHHFYDQLLEAIEPFTSETPDGVSWSDPAVNHSEINSMLRELS